jgi:hypothetical protein
MNRKIYVMGILSIILVLMTPPSHCLEVTTHELLNERISVSTFKDFSLDVYLKKYLGFSMGVYERVNKQPVFQWIKDGGRYEDKPESSIPYRRSVNHYHNPLTDKGYSGIFGGLFLSGESLIDWAQKPLNTQSPGGHYSWHDVRNYYYKALTSISKNEKEKYFSETFRGIGQLMHLVQDASVPAHTRDHAHLFEYEYWLAKNSPDLTKEPTFFDRLILDRPTTGLPISNIFDTNQYKGGNPEVTAGNYIGLTEYANANFFSDDTINSRNFPNPRFDDQTTIVGRPYLSEYGIYTRKYYLKECCGETNQGKGYLLAAVDYYDDWRRKSPYDIGELEKLPVLDNNVYAEYASLLIPRAVGYSAGLLEYFFRGKIQVSSHPIFYDNALYMLKLKIKNMTPNEDMRNGNLMLTYRYTPPGKPEDGSEDVFNYAFSMEGSLTVPIVELKSGGETEVYFAFLWDSIPIEALNSSKLSLVFQGTLGNETGAVVGKVFNPGTVLFNEEWDKGLHGNHTWEHMGIDEPFPLPDRGSVSNIVENGILQKDHFISGGVLFSLNDSTIGIFSSTDKYQDVFPLLVTPDTYLQFKIDDISIAYSPAAPSPGWADHYQCLRMDFNNGLILLFSQGEYDPVFDRTREAHYIFPLGYIIVDNIYRLFQDAGIIIPEGPLYLYKIGFHQLLFYTDNDTEYHEQMKVDFVRIIEGKEE